MGNGFCCQRAGEPEPEISSTKTKPIKINSIYKNNKTINPYIQKSNKKIENRMSFTNKITKIGKILNSDFFDSIPNKIKKYIEENPYEKLDKKITESTTDSLEKIENINYSKPIQLKNNNIIYLGEWTKQGIINGKGKMFKPDSETFIQGEWVNGSLKFGRIINNKSVYIGYIEDNEFHGNGKFYEFNGNLYEGNFSQGQKSGQGKYIYSDGCTYEGNFENNEMNGKGEFNWINGIKYNGEFYKGIFHGYGLLKWKNNKVYNGQFKKGFFNGNGVFYWKNEEEYYKGEYLNNYKNGKGLYKFKNGDIYIGQWVNNMPSGKGTYETKNKIYTGIWKDGNFLEIIDIVSKYQSGEINEIIDFNFKANIENIDISSLEHINIKMMIEIN